VQVLVLSFLPESPRWLLALHTPAECLESMRTLRRTNDVSLSVSHRIPGCLFSRVPLLQVSKEFNDIYLALSTDARLGESWVDILSSKTIRYRLFVCCVIQLSQQMAGIQIVTTFGSDFLELLNMHSILLGLSLAYTSAMMGTFLGVFNVDIWGRYSMSSHESTPHRTLIPPHTATRAGGSCCSSAACP
jgi:hypothetical protein